MHCTIISRLTPRPAVTARMDLTDRRRRGLLIVLSSPSGQAPTICACFGSRPRRHHVDIRDDRPKRLGETDDVDYHFVDDRELTG